MSLQITFANESATEPVTLAEAKAWMKIDVNDDDLIITPLIKAARQSIEKWCGISIVTKDVTLHYTFPDEYDEEIVIELPYGPVRSTTYTVASLNSAGTETAVSATSYLILGADGSFKTFRTGSLAGLHKITYQAGYANAAATPQDLKQAILTEVDYRYNNRGDKTNKPVDGVRGLSEDAMILAHAYKSFAWL